MPKSLKQCFKSILFSVVKCYNVASFMKNKIKLLKGIPSNGRFCNITELSLILSTYIWWYNSTLELLLFNVYHRYNKMSSIKILYIVYLNLNYK